MRAFIVLVAMGYGLMSAYVSATCNEVYVGIGRWVGLQMHFTGMVVYPSEACYRQKWLDRNQDHKNVAGNNH